MAELKWNFDVDFEKLKSPEDIEREAKRLLPVVLKGLCDQLAEEGALVLEKAGAQFDSPKDRAEQVRKMAGECEDEKRAEVLAWIVKELETKIEEGDTGPP